MYGYNATIGPGDSTIAWKKIPRDKKTLPKDKLFLVWAPNDAPEVVAARVWEIEGELFILYADELLCDVAPDGVISATHWADYPKGPVDT